IIAENWNPEGFTESLYAVLMLEINTDGSLKSIKTVSESGNKKFDREAIKAVKLSAPFKAMAPSAEPIKMEYYFDLQFNTEDYVMKSEEIGSF
ncbi:MAG: hypothetical protein CUN55_17370, partial [Phototrophicales bacterium]